MAILRKSNLGKTIKQNKQLSADPLWLKKLLSIIKNNPRTKFRILRVPIHNEVFHEEDPYLKIIETIVDLENVEFQDFQGLELSDDNFKDFTHLSSSGAKKLSLEYLNRNEPTE